MQVLCLRIDDGECEVAGMDILSVAEICKALSDENRLRIIEMLTKGEKCGCDLLDQLHITQPTLSHHMKVLEGCGLVSSYKEGKWNHYSINCDRFREFKDYINGISCCQEVQDGNCCSGSSCCNS